MECAKGHRMRAEDDNVLRVVLLGKTGVGKSSTGNTLLHREAFQVGRGLCSGTERCQWADAQVEDITLQVTDTPGLSDTHRSEEEVLREVGKSIAVASPGPHVILMVIRCDARFTAEEYTAYVTLREMFGPAIKQHMIVVFVGTDTYGDALEQQKDGLRQEMREPSMPLKEILEAADGRFFGISNKADKGNRRRQAAELIELMKDLKRQRGGAYFESEVSAEVNSMVAPLVNNRAARGNMTRDDAIRQTNLAIVDEKESSDFFDRLFTTLQRRVLPKIKKGLEVAKEALLVMKTGIEFIQEVRESCSVM